MIQCVKETEEPTERIQNDKMEYLEKQCDIEL